MKTSNKNRKKVVDEPIEEIQPKLPIKSVITHSNVVRRKREQRIELLEDPILLFSTILVVVFFLSFLA